jgi:hypothetical protein
MMAALFDHEQRLTPERLRPAAGAALMFASLM